jgi:hypothetical protein
MIQAIIDGIGHFINDTTRSVMGVSDYNVLPQSQQPENVTRSCNGCNSHAQQDKDIPNPDSNITFNSERNVSSLEYRKKEQVIDNQIGIDTNINTNMNNIILKFN